MTIQTSEWVFYVLLTAKSYGDVDLSLKSNMKGLRTSEAWDRTHDPWMTRREASHYTTQAQFPNISYC